MALGLWRVCACPRSLPIHGAPGAIQDLQLVAVSQTPVDARLLGLPGLPFGVIDTDPANLGIPEAKVRKEDLRQSL